MGEKLRRIVEQAPFPGEQAMPSERLTISVGTACHPEDASTPQQLIERADWALYQAKERGRNRVCVWEGEEQADTG